MKPLQHAGSMGAYERCIHYREIWECMTRGWPEELSEFGPPGLLFLIGLTLATAAILTGLATPDIAGTVESVIIGTLAIGVVARGLTLLTSDTDEAEKWRVAAWCLVGTLSASVLSGILLMRAALHADTIANPLGLVEMFAGLGAVAGLFVGGTQVRAIRAGRSSERKHTSELLEKREEERLTFLNNLLRHNVLNGMNIVLGYANALDDRLDGSDEYVEHIRSRSENVVELVQNVQVLVRSLSGDLEVDAVDLTETATRQLDRARKTHDATFHADLTPGVTVATTPFISSAIDNLLANAVVHNPAPEPEVTLRVDRTDDTGRIAVVDNGPGIPQNVIDTYFGNPDPDDHFVGDGLGLYLVEELVTTHGGDIIVDSTSGGTTVTLEFPLTTDTVPVDEARAEATV